MAYFIVILTYIMSIQALSLLFAQTSSVYAQSVSIQIDGSGSMAGFDNSKELDVLVNILKKACDQTDIPSETVFFCFNPIRYSNLA